MTKKIKYIRILITFLCIVPIVGAMYYFRPLSASSILVELENVERISFNVRFDEKKEHEFLGTVITGKEAEYFKNLLNMTKYRRSFGRTNIQSTSNAYDIVLVYNSNNYSIVINDRGFVVVEVMGSKKKYRILSSKSDILLKLIDELLLSK